MAKTMLPPQGKLSALKIDDAMEFLLERYKRC
jgi:hypothetical protein